MVPDQAQQTSQPSRSSELANLCVLRGFRVSMHRNVSGLALKASSWMDTNKIIDHETVQQRLAALYHADPQRFEKNVQQFVGRKALYVPTQRVIRVASVRLDEDKNKLYPHRTNLVKKDFVTSVAPERYGLIADDKGFVSCTFNLKQSTAPRSKRRSST